MSTLPELIQRLRKESPAAVGKLDDRIALRLVRAAFAAVASEVRAAPDGVHKIGGLGTFRVRTIAADAATGKAAARRVLFNAAAKKAPAATK